MKKTNLQFAKYYPSMSLIFSPVEQIFIMHLSYIEGLRSADYEIDWTIKRINKRMGISEYSFYKCLDKFIRLKVVEKIIEEKKPLLYFNQALFDKGIHALKQLKNAKQIAEYKRLFIDSGDFKAISEDRIKTILKINAK